MNIDTFASLKQLKDNLACEQVNSLAAMNEVKIKCREAVRLIDGLRFKNNSAHVQLATKHALQYLTKALFETEAYLAAYDAVSRSSTVNIKDICRPAHAGLEIILNLNYERT